MIAPPIWTGSATNALVFFMPTLTASCCKIAMLPRAKPKLKRVKIEDIHTRDENYFLWGPRLPVYAHKKKKKIKATG